MQKLFQTILGGRFWLENASSTSTTINFWNDLTQSRRLSWRKTRTSINTMKRNKLKRFVRNIKERKRHLRIKCVGSVKSVSQCLKKFGHNLKVWKLSPKCQNQISENLRQCQSILVNTLKHPNLHQNFAVISEPVRFCN